MNILKDSAGAVSSKHIKKRGFEVFETAKSNDMGQVIEMPQYQNDEIQIVGGYWNYIVKNRKTGATLWLGWWNSNDEFDETINELLAKI